MCLRGRGAGLRWLEGSDDRLCLGLVIGGSAVFSGDDVHDVEVSAATGSADLDEGHLGISEEKAVNATREDGYQEDHLRVFLDRVVLGREGCFLLVRETSRKLRNFCNAEFCHDSP
jgi:hypothetical protein